MEQNKVTRHSAFHWSIHTTTEIDASPDVVWRVLTDFEAMPRWSKALQSIEGDFSKDGKTVVLYIFKGKLRRLKHVMKYYREGVEFGWSDPLIPLSRDNHLYRLEPLPGGRTRFIQSDEIRGFSTPLIAKMLMGQMKVTYPEFNRALKAEAESRR